MKHIFTYTFTHHPCKEKPSTSSIASLSFIKMQPSPKSNSIALQPSYEKVFYDFPLFNYLALNFLCSQMKLLLEELKLILQLSPFPSRGLIIYSSFPIFAILYKAAIFFIFISQNNSQLLALILYLTNLCFLINLKSPTP